MSFPQMCAVLIAEPYNLTLEEIGDLTDEQLLDIFFRPRDEDDKPLSDAELERIGWFGDEDSETPRLAGREIASNDYKAQFWYINRDVRGMTEEECMAAWREYLKGDPAEAKLHPEDLA